MLLPLLDRNPSGLIAILQTSLSPLRGKSEIFTSDFIGQALELSKLLPDRGYAINLCGNRYLFMLSFCAVVLRRQTNLLPPNKSLSTQEALANRYDSCYIIHDKGAVSQSAGEIDLASGILHFALSEVDLAEVSANHGAPKIEAGHLAAIVFTSGSTGESKPIAKTWRTYHDSSRINVRHMLPDVAMNFSALATVPGQHMWGLETSVLNPLFSNMAVSDSRLLFPKDIQSELARLPEPRMLISTPVHLRALVNSGLRFPKVERILCATAPLVESLAQDVERVFEGELCEVFGCSEVGSMAHRRTSQKSLWNLFQGISLKANKQGTLASADHLASDQQLQDVIEMLPENRFKLCGRHSDMVEIAGKRGSLQEINRVLLSMPEVADGAVFMPEESSAKVPRLAALVVLKNSIEKNEITKYIKGRLDSAFVPRPLLFVDALPREENGKLPRQKLLDFYKALRA